MKSHFIMRESVELLDTVLHRVIFCFKLWVTTVLSEYTVCVILESIVVLQPCGGVIQARTNH